VVRSWWHFDFQYLSLAAWKWAQPSISSLTRCVLSTHPSEHQYDNLTLSLFCEVKLGRQSYYLYRTSLNYTYKIIIFNSPSSIHYHNVLILNQQAKDCCWGAPSEWIMYKISAELVWIISVKLPLDFKLITGIKSFLKETMKRLLDSTHHEAAVLWSKGEHEQANWWARLRSVR